MLRVVLGCTAGGDMPMRPVGRLQGGVYFQLVTAAHHIAQALVIGIDSTPPAGIPESIERSRVPGAGGPVLAIIRFLSTRGTGFSPLC